MDRQLKDILDKYFPFEEDEYYSRELWQKKRQLRLNVEKVLIEYNATKKLNLPTGLSVDMVEVIKKMTEEN